MFRIFHKKEILRRGDLVEIALTADAVRHIDAYEWYAKDKNEETNLPGRTHSGYIIAVEDHYISLTSDWNKSTNEPTNGRIIFYKEAIKSVKKR